MYKLSKRSRSRIDGIEQVLIEIIECAIVTSPYDFGIPEFGGKTNDSDQQIMYS